MVEEFGSEFGRAVRGWMNVVVCEHLTCPSGRWYKNCKYIADRNDMPRRYTSDILINGGIFLHCVQ